MILASDLVALFRQALSEQWGYIWGQWGAEWTSAKQNQKVNYMVSKYGSGWKTDCAAKNDNYYYSALYGAKWIGCRVADCSGLFRWALDRLGLAVSHSSNRIWESYCSSRGRLVNGARSDGQPLLPGTAVFVHPAGKNRTHIGLYVGDGMVIEASGTQAGVIQSAVTNKKWVEWGELKGVSFDGVRETAGKGSETVTVILKKGDKGEAVREAQSLLLQRGYDLGKWGADGDFGSATEAAVRQFQRDAGLDPDGILGPQTLEALRKEVPEVLYTVTVPHLSPQEAEKLVKQYPAASKKEEGKESV